MYKVVELENMTLLAMRYWEHDIAVISLDGTVLHSNNGSETPGLGPVPGRMGNPLDVAVDKDGFILVCETDYRQIFVFNPTLTESRLFPFSSNESPNFPKGLCYDSDTGRLIVGEISWEKRVRIYDNVFKLSSLFE